LGAQGRPATREESERLPLLATQGRALGQLVELTSYRRLVAEPSLLQLADVPPQGGEARARLVNHDRPGDEIAQATEARVEDHGEEPESVEGRQQIRRPH